jgi:hypothetical protein
MADISVTAANVVTVSGTITRGTAGATLTAGLWCYLDPTDNRWKPATTEGDVTTAAAAGVSLNPAAAGQPVSIQQDGVYTCGGTIVVGTFYVLSVAGGFAPIADLASGDRPVLVGFGLTIANMEIHIINTGVDT